MQALNSLKDTIFNIANDADFERAALSVFYAQAEQNEIYSSYIKSLGVDVKNVTAITDIPFLPISFFKSHNVVTGHFTPEATFSSSGTTGATNSKHFVKNTSIYSKSFTRGFQHFYGSPQNFCILALLPSYLEKSGSSLVFMADDFITKSAQPQSGFYLDNHDALIAQLKELAKRETPTLLLGVSFALLDIAEKMPKDFDHPHLTIMETGGMKGRRKEMIRTEMHAILKDAFHVETIHSEYGMTELLSQAYSKGNGLFKTPPWMKVFVRDTTDPLTLIGNEKTGGLNIIDLANIYSCAFLATEDLGKTNLNGTFEVLGRFDTAEIRGCNLMVE